MLCTIRDLQKTEWQTSIVDPQNAGVLTLQNQRFVADFVKFDFENISPKCFLRAFALRMLQDRHGRGEQLTKFADGDIFIQISIKSMNINIKFTFLM